MIKGALDAKREERNLAAVQKQLIAGSSQRRNSPTPAPAMMAEVPVQGATGPAQALEHACLEELDDEAPIMPTNPKVEGKNRSGSAARRASALTPGATWPLDSEGKQKRIANFRAPEKKTVLCMFERRAKGSCSKGTACEFCHEIPDGKTKGSKGDGKKGKAGKGAAKTAAAAAAAASTATGSQGEKLSAQVWSHNGYGSVFKLAQALAALTISGEAPDAAMRISSSLLACGHLHSTPIADALLTSSVLAPPGLEQPPNESWQTWRG